MKFFDKILGGGSVPEELSEDYIEIENEVKGPKSKIVVKPFILTDFNDIKPLVDNIREGYTIALINVKPLKEKDVIELKRAINKLKKTTDALNGDIAGFGEDWVVVTPSFASIYRSKATESLDE